VNCGSSNPGACACTSTTIDHCRDNWYRFAWSELRKGQRSFAIGSVYNFLETITYDHDIAEKTLNDHYASSYGIFAGKANKMALLRFSKDRARWVTDERWHPQQVGQYLVDGRYELRIPYRDERELVMDVLRHGADVEVVSPVALRDKIKIQLNQALKPYSST
jgi:proteasome accessory factor C